MVDGKFSGIRSGSALFVYVPQKDARLIYAELNQILCLCFTFQFGCFYQDEPTVVFTSYSSVVTDRSRSQGDY